MKTRRFSIRRKMQIVILLISVFALLLATYIGVNCMLIIQQEVLTISDALGNEVTFFSERELKDQLSESLLDIVASQAKLADEKLGAFMRYADMFARYTETLYNRPGEFVPVSVLPPDKANKDILSMQRFLANESVTPETVITEMNLLGNLVNVFDPVIRENEEMITEIYVATESGFLLSYNARADLGDTDSPEEYYEFTESAWYTLAKQAGKPVFTDTYQDRYGRGLTISCTVPFYRDGEFLGAVGMDILVADLNNSITDLSLDSRSYAFLVSAKGEIIAHSKQDQSDIYGLAYEVADSILNGNTAVITEDRHGFYCAYAPVPSASWTLAINVPSEVVAQPVAELRDVIDSNMETTSFDIRVAIMTGIVLFIFAFLLIIIIVTIVSSRFSRRLTKPLISLREDVNIISGGNLEHRAIVVTKDEIGDLAGAFNNMTGSLQTYIANLTAITAEKERIGAELDVATKIQASMLPCIFPPFPERSEFDIYASMQPAKEVGGDFYDFFLVDENTLAVVIADVSGKSVPAALFMVIAKTLIKNNAQSGKSPKEVFETVNNILCENNDAGMFVTAFMGYLNIPNGSFTFVNAGHNQPLLRTGVRFDWLKAKAGFVLAGMEDMLYKQHEITLNPGDELFLYTDGVTEAVNNENELFGDPRLLGAANQYVGFPISEFAVSIKHEIDSFAEGAEQADDITMLTLRYKGETK